MVVTDRTEAETLGVLVSKLLEIDAPLVTH
jgi:acetoacetate decarboxylase